MASEPGMATTRISTARDMACGHVMQQAYRVSPQRRRESSSCGHSVDFHSHSPHSVNAGMLSRVPVFHSRTAFALLALLLSGSCCGGVRGAPVDMDPDRAADAPPPGLSAFANFPLTRTMITRTTVVTTAVTGQTSTTRPLPRDEDALTKDIGDNPEKTLSVQTPDPDQGDAIDELERDVVEWRTGNRPSGPLICKGACDRRELLLLVVAGSCCCCCCCCCSFCCFGYLSIL